VDVWIGDYGTYVIPEDIFKASKLTKNGILDKRYKGNKALKEYVEKMEQENGPSRT
jgi:hypothetical protein